MLWWYLLKEANVDTTPKPRIYWIMKLHILKEQTVHDIITQIHKSTKKILFVLMASAVNDTMFCKQNFFKWVSKSYKVYKKSRKTP